MHGSSEGRFSITYCPGGLTREEKEMAAAGEFRPIRLGPRIMRTETAALAAISFAQTVWGDFSASR